MGETFPLRPSILTGYIPTTSIDDGKDCQYRDTRTKFGGLNPFLNLGERWPLCQTCGRPQTFVLQINLEDDKVPLLIREKLRNGGGEGIFQIFLCLGWEWQGDNPILVKCVGWWWTNSQFHSRAIFVTPKAFPTNNRPPSLSNLAATRIADEILEEYPLVSVAGHPLLEYLPDHLQTVIISLVEEYRSLKQREYCTDALKNVRNFLAFDNHNTTLVAEEKNKNDKNEEVEDSTNFYFSPVSFSSWAECAVEIDPREAEPQVEKKFEIEKLNPPTDEIEFFEGNYKHDQWPNSGHPRHLFLGWPRWDQLGPKYPLCPNDKSHGICSELILTCTRGGAGEAFDTMMGFDNWWLLLFKCPLCSGFAFLGV